MSSNLAIFHNGGARPPRHPLFGAAFDAACVRTARSPASIARFINVHPSTLLSYRRGHSRPTGDKLKRAEQLFGPLP